VSSDQDRSAELDWLLERLCEEQLSEPQRQRLNELLREDKNARLRYLSEVHMHAALSYFAGLPEVRIQPDKKPTAKPLVVFDFLGDAFGQGIRFFSNGLIVSLLLAIGLPAVVLVVLVVDMARQAAAPVPVAVAPPPAPAAVAELTGSHQCVWGGKNAGLPPGTKIIRGTELELKKGLAEITFADGASVILRGPATFRVRDSRSGLLDLGSLAATVPPPARGFTVQTPTATIVDLGTEFGVCVNKKGLATDVQVFQGEVELAPTAAKGHDVPRRRLAAGRAVRVAMNSRESAAVITEIAPQQGRFARQLPAPAESTQPAIVADFSGGAGNSQADQFPGTAGSGWATAWGIGDAKDLTCIASVEQDRPLLGGGDYLSVLVERRPDGKNASAWTAVDRRLAATDGVDLSKPYVVSFNLRIDKLNRFSESDDRLSICTRNVSQTEFSLKKISASSGWHICMVGKGGKGSRLATSKNWTFLQRTDDGEAVAVDSGICPREGSVYSFRILVDPKEKKWTPSIAVDGGQPTAFAPMGMRSSGTAEANKYWAFIHFFCQLNGGNNAEDVERIGFSVDSIRITPE